MSTRKFMLLALLLLLSAPWLTKCDDYQDEDDSREEDYYDVESDVWLREGQLGERYTVRTLVEGQSVALNCTAVSERSDRLWSFHISWEYRDSVDKVLSPEFDDLSGHSFNQPTYKVQQYAYEFDNLYAFVHTLHIESVRPTDSGFYICTLSPNNTSTALAEYNTVHLYYELIVTASGESRTTTITTTTTTATTAASTNTSRSEPPSVASTSFSNFSAESESLNGVTDNNQADSSHSELTPYEVTVMDCCIARDLHVSSCINACGLDVRTMVQFDWSQECRWPEARVALQCHFKASSKVLASLPRRPASPSESNQFAVRDCCVQKRVSANCMHVCAGYNVFADDEGCLPEFARILECTFSSVNSIAIPKPPRFVRLLRLSPSRVKVRWLPPAPATAPARDEKKVVGYEVYYAFESAQPNATMQIEYQRVSTRALSVVLEINDNSVLSVFVQSFNIHGFSEPSEEVRMTTARSLFDVLHSVRSSNFDHAGRLQETARARIFECCAQRIPQECARLFCSSNATSSSSNLRQREIDEQQAELIDHCLFSLPDVLACFANDRDVTQCCVQEQVAGSCISFCGDHFDNTNLISNPNSNSNSIVVSAESIFAHESCIYDLGKMRNCFVRGWLSTPSPPRALQFVRLSCSSELENATCAVELKWQTPLENAHQTSWYAVQVFTTVSSSSGSTSGGNHDQLTAKLPAIRVDSSTHEVLVGGLDVGEKYDFSVIAVSSFGQSAPSNHVRVLTLPRARASRSPLSDGEKGGRLSAHVVSRSSDSIQVSWIDLASWNESEQLPDLYTSINISTNLSTTRLLSQRSPTIDSNSNSTRYYTVACRRLFPPVDNESFVNLIIVRDADTVAEKMAVLHNLRSAAEYEITIQLFDRDGDVLPAPVAQARLIEWTSLPPFRHPDSPNYSRPDSDSVRDALQSAKANNINLTNSSASNSTARISRCCANAHAQSRTANPDCLRLLCDETYTRNASASAPLSESVVSYCSFAEVARTFSCFSGGDDRSLCCQMSYLPDRCVDFCTGERDSATVFGDSSVRLTLCAPHLAKIRSCFLDSSASLPGRPQISESYALNESALFIGWNRKSQSTNADGSGDGASRYLIFFRRANDSLDLTLVRSVDSSMQYAVISQLEPATAYTVYVVAVNQHGASLPSAQVAVETYEANETFVHIVQMPRSALNIHPEGSALALHCVAPVQLASTLTWYRNSNRVRNVSPRVFFRGTHNETLVFGSVMRNDVGRYMCSVRGEAGTVFISQPTFINVQYEPTATVFDNVVESALFDTKDLTCLFSGSPASVRWFRADNQREIVSGAGSSGADISFGRYAIQTLSYPSDPMTHSTLTIYGVLFPDFGTYSCVATNKFGYANGSIELRPDFQRVGGLASASNAGSLNKCCADAGASSKCAPFCTYAIPEHSNLTVRSLRSCLNEAGWQNASSIWRCLSSGRDHRPCCSQMRIPEECHQLCAGVAPPDDDSVFRCFNYRLDMLRCFKEGVATIPAQPGPVEVAKSFDNSSRILRVTLTWTSEPQDRALTQYYRIDLLNVTSNRLLSTERVIVDRNATVLAESYEIQLFSSYSHTYALTVTAVGRFGSSLPTEPRLISTRTAPVNIIRTTETRSEAYASRDQISVLVGHNDDQEVIIFAVCVLLLLLSALMVTTLVFLYRSGLQGFHDKLRRVRTMLTRLGQSIHDHLPAADCSVTARFTDEAAESNVGSTVNIPLDCSNLDSLVNNDVLAHASHSHACE